MTIRRLVLVAGWIIVFSILRGRVDLVVARRFALLVSPSLRGCEGSYCRVSTLRSPARWRTIWVAQGVQLQGSAPGFCVGVGLFLVRGGG